MNILSNEDGQVWLNRHGLCRKKLVALSKARPDLSLSGFTSVHSLASFVQEIHTKGFARAPCLMRIDDWGLYQPCELAVMELMRKKLARKNLDLVKYPYHIVEKDGDSFQALMGFFCLTYGFKWKATLIFPAGTLAIENWEGEYLDFWSPSSAIMEYLQELSAQYGLLCEQASKNSTGRRFGAQVSSDGVRTSG